MVRLPKQLFLLLAAERHHLPVQRLHCLRKRCIHQHSRAAFQHLRFTAGIQHRLSLRQLCPRHFPAERHPPLEQLDHLPVDFIQLLPDLCKFPHSSAHPC